MIGRLWNGARAYLWMGLGAFCLGSGIWRGVLEQDVRLPRMLGRQRVQGSAAVIAGLGFAVLGAIIFYHGIQKLQSPDEEGILDS